MTWYSLFIHLRSVNDKVQKEQKSDKKYGKDYMKSMCTSSDYGENMCKIPKRLVYNCMRSCAHEVSSVYMLRVKNDIHNVEKVKKITNNYIQITCTSSYHEENTCKVS